MTNPVPPVSGEFHRTAGANDADLRCATKLSS
jgi:hypothetical protein